MQRRPRTALQGDDSVRSRIQTRVSAENRRGSRTLVMATLALSIFLLLGALSLFQVTAPERATSLLRQGIASATEVDLLLAQDGDTIRRFAEASKDPVIGVPGYPVTVAVTREEVLKNNNDQLANLLLDRSAALVYRQGLAAFDVTGAQSVSLFSAQGLLDLLIGRLSASTHDHARQASLVFAAIAALSAIVLSIQLQGFARLRVLGQAVLIGAIPGLLFCLGATFILDRLGSNDPFVSDIRSLVRSVIDVPARNYAVVAIGAAIVMASGIVLGLVSKRFGPAKSGDEDWSEAEYEPES